MCFVEFLKIKHAKTSKISVAHKSKYVIFNVLLIIKDVKLLSILGKVAHALFLDWTHDNPSPVEKRTIEDMLPSAGLVTMAR